MRYVKPALTFADQVALLQARGLIIEDHAFAEDTLSHISYYRLSAYFKPFRQAGTERFAGATFTDVLMLYKFDKDLRLLVSDALEAIEVHFRTRITYQKEIAEDIGVHQSVLRTGLHTLSCVRNICAHYSRFWNRELAISPKFPNKSERWPYLGIGPKRTYGVLVLICDLLARISPAAKCRESLKDHLASANAMQLAGIWAPKNWAAYAPWTATQATREGD